MPVMDRQGFYPSDLSEAQWESIREFVPSARSGGRPRGTNVREVINAILYLVNAGCAWRYLPKDFPPWKTVYHYYRSWTMNGVWRLIHDALVKSTRKRAGKNETPSYLIIDSQSVKANSGELLGYDGFKPYAGESGKSWSIPWGLCTEFIFTPPICRTPKKEQS